MIVLGIIFLLVLFVPPLRRMLFWMLLLRRWRRRRWYRGGGYSGGGGFGGGGGGFGGFGGGSSGGGGASGRMVAPASAGCPESILPSAMRRDAPRQPRTAALQRRQQEDLKMVAEKQLDEFVSRMQKAAGENLQSVILYGSAAAGDFNPEFSNLNLLCILRDTSFARLSAIASVVEWWHRHKHPAPLVMTREELERSADVFSIELLDMQQHHRVLFGDERVDRVANPHAPASRASWNTNCARSSSCCGSACCWRQRNDRDSLGLAAGLVSPRSPRCCGMR